MESSEFTGGMEFDYLMRVIKENHELKQVNIEVLRFFLSEEPQTEEIKNHSRRELKISEADYVFLTMMFYQTSPSLASGLYSPCLS